MKSCVSLIPKDLAERWQIIESFLVAQIWHLMYKAFICAQSTTLWQKATIAEFGLWMMLLVAGLQMFSPANTWHSQGNTHSRSEIFREVVSSRRNNRGIAGPGLEEQH